MATMPSHRSRPGHESEWIYSLILSRQLTALNEHIHQIPSVPLTAELLIAFCGYAFNPVMFPFWPLLIYGLSRSGISNSSYSSSLSSPRGWNQKWRGELESFAPEHAAMVNTALYLSSVLITLAFTELGKASFATTRPRAPEDGENSQQRPWKRRFGKLVASLKSKHSFPSGDSAQAMNLCMFLHGYVPLEGAASSYGKNLIDFSLFGVFLPGVAFARVFYRCHWIEDCIGGIFLAAILHFTLIPALASKLSLELLDPWLVYLFPMDGGSAY